MWERFNISLFLEICILKGFQECFGRLKRGHRALKAFSLCPFRAGSSLSVQHKGLLCSACFRLCRHVTD